MRPNLVSTTYLLLLSIGIAMAGGESPVGPTERFAIVGLQPFYHGSQEVTAELISTAPRAMYFYCAAEQQTPDGWREVVLSVAQTHASKSVTSRKIGPGERVAITWRPKEQWRIYPGLTAGRYRFVVRLTEINRPEITVQTVRSAPFELGQFVD